MDDGFLLPQIDELGAPFWEGAAAGEVRIQACESCGALRFPPRPMCPACRGVASTWRPMSGRGTVWSFIVPHPPVLPEFAEVTPYTVVVVALDDDPHIRLIGNLVSGGDASVDSVDPTTITIGMPVVAVFPEVVPGHWLVRWAPLPEPI